ncbi:isochorismatase family protein [Hahella sp. KA22]|uniref:isochorismatase family protein n=1 Tax=Hahella sp. KA22 TaxID=1628392 RepID=UPI000FDE992D|nr:isochorismatase family protein [Hahella sp. KA22]AZZ93223.1 isochorismatase family protein [Hahella sp. KA22]QAY56597.1 isochorismatase family protein [Hahella sp. KA22]
MTIINTVSLHEAMNNEVKKGRKKLALFVIDEQGGQAPRNHASLLATITKAQTLRMPIYLIEIDHAALGQGAQPVVIGGAAPVGVRTWRDYCVRGATVVKKPHISMFNPETNLDIAAEIKRQNITGAVIIGTQTNQCVKVNAVGGYVDRLNTKKFDGLNKLCKVYTCGAALRGTEEATWKNEPNVFYYNHLEVAPRPHR